MLLLLPIWPAWVCMPICVSGLDRNLLLYWVPRPNFEALVKLTLEVELSPQGLLGRTRLLPLEDCFLVDLSWSPPLLGAMLPEKEAAGSTGVVVDPVVGSLGNSGVPRNTLSPVWAVVSWPMESCCFQPALGSVQNVSRN